MLRPPQTSKSESGSSRIDGQRHHRPHVIVKQSDDKHDAALESSMTVAEYVERRFVPSHVRLKSDAGRRHYQAILKHILDPEKVHRIFAEISEWQTSRLRCLQGWPYLDDIELCNLHPDHVQRLIDSASDRGYSPQTIKHIKNVVGAIVAHAQSEGIFKGDNPASKIQLQPVVHRALHNITLQQAKAIVALLDGTEREIALLSLTTGMSVFEICKLQWKHVNLSSTPATCEGETIPPRCILVRRESISPGLSAPNNSRTKTVDIPEPLFRRLLRTKRLQQYTRPEAYVLGNLGGVPPSEFTVSRARLVRVGRELGIPWLSWQVLKRGHQALLAELRDQLSGNLVASAP